MWRLRKAPLTSLVNELNRQQEFAIYGKYADLDNRLSYECNFKRKPRENKTKKVNQLYDLWEINLIDKLHRRESKVRKEPRE